MKKNAVLTLMFLFGIVILSAYKLLAEPAKTTFTKVNPATIIAVTTKPGDASEANKKKTPTPAYSKFRVNNHSSLMIKIYTEKGYQGSIGPKGHAGSSVPTDSQVFFAGYNTGRTTMVAYWSATVSATSSNVFDLYF